MWIIEIKKFMNIPNQERHTFTTLRDNHPFSIGFLGAREHADEIWDVSGIKKRDSSSFLIG